ncbi:MAG: hypothetical protein PWQ62_1234 [Candidatus Methanomethylophilaceae archaeon]|nr:hypothetical protein [Candidatus Methanomethylophilaceae archaeon]
MNIVGEGNLAQSYLIGQLGKADGTSEIMATRLINDSIDIIKKANEKVGCRVIHLECKKIKKLVELYEKHGFHTVVKGDSQNLNTMVLFL